MKTFSQDSALVNLKGVIVDSVNTNPVPYATIRVKHAGSGKTKAFLTDSVGRFVLDELTPSIYEVRFSATGYADKIYNLDLKEKKHVNSLADVRLFKSYGTLSEVIIRSRGPLITREIDRLSYNIQADPESSFRSVGEMMTKVPLVTITADNSLLIRGQSGVKVYINNKPSGLVASNPVEALNSIPASDIVKIEVITTPPANFDGEGVAGIINIVTVRKTNQAFHGRLNARYVFPASGPTFGGAINGSHKKFNYSVIASVSHTNTPRVGSSFERFSKNCVPQVIQNGTTRSRYNFYNIQLQTSYEIDSLNLISNSVGINNYDARFDNFRVANIFSSYGQLDQSYSVTGTNDFASSNLFAWLNYEHRFKKNRQHFYTVSYYYVRAGLLQNSIDELQSIANYTERINYFQKDGNGRDENTAQLDFVLPSKKFYVEFGGKGVFRTNFSNFFYERDTINKPHFRLDNNFRYYQTITALYSSVNFKLKTFTIKSGVRIEHTQNRFRLSSQNKIKQQYTNALPSISLQNKISQRHSITLGYSRRIWRPDIVQLNPFINVKDPLTISSGNPYLLPAISNNYELFYNYSSKINFDVGVNYFTSRDNIEIVSDYDSLARITKTTYKNASIKRSFNVSVSLNYQMRNGISWNSNSNLSYQWIDGSNEYNLYRQSGYTYNLYGAISKRFKNNFTVSVTSSYNNGILLLQGQTPSFGTYSTSVTKIFLDNRLTTSLAINNVFNKYRYLISRFVVDESIQTVTSERFYRQISLSINFRFGKGKSQPRRTKREIFNDDIKS